MRWTKVRQLVEASFAESVRDRVRLQLANSSPRGRKYADCCTMGTLSVDGVEVARTNPHGLRRMTVWLPGSWRPMHIVDPRPEQSVRPTDIVGETGDLGPACWDYLHNSLNESLASTDPFQSSLAVLNAKVGRQRLTRMAQRADLHPLTRYMLDFRLRADAEHRAKQRTATVA